MYVYDSRWTTADSSTCLAVKLPKKKKKPISRLKYSFFCSILNQSVVQENRTSLKKESQSKILWGISYSNLQSHLRNHLICDVIS